MKKIIIPVEITSDILVALNETEMEVKEHFQIAIAGVVLTWNRSRYFPRSTGSFALSRISLAWAQDDV